jgi:hypothetical protein
MPELWRDVSDSILFSMQFEERLGNAEALRFAREIISRPLKYLTAEEEYAAIAEALRSDARLTELVPESHGEQEYRDFLRRVLSSLDALRPWPDLPFRPVDVSQWHDFDAARLTARIKLSVIGVERQVHRAFRHTDAVRNRVLGLRLRSGTEVVLVDDWWAPGSKDVALLQRDPHQPPAQVIAEFLEATGLTKDQIVPVAG